MNKIYGSLLYENQFNLNQTNLQPPDVSIGYYNQNKLAPKKTLLGKIVDISIKYTIVYCVQSQS